MNFPDGFLWGVAAAAYQIEGGADADGRGPSVWDAFCRRPDAVFDNHSGRGATDHFHRYPEDVSILADLGAKAYRLSVSWPRVLPAGVGQVNAAGLDFYDRLVDALLARAIEPWITLFHWDFPLALFHRGGWLNRDSAAWFAEYAEVLTRRLGDRVKHWITLNEPQVHLGFGHAEGRHAPGVRYDRPALLSAIHHTLLAHGRAVRVIRSTVGDGAQVGWAAQGEIPYPATHGAADIAAARAAFAAVPARDDWYFSTTWFADPVILGRYPEDGLARFGDDMPAGFEADMDELAPPLDFYGVNIYKGAPITAGLGGAPVENPRPAGYPQTLFHWPVEPQALYWGAKLLHERYGLPLYITENGCAAMDWVHQDGHVHDAPRIDFLARYLAALRQAIADGVDVRGYFHWSLTDNFEWAEGYRMRFGLVYVDYETQQRIPKDSFAWFGNVIASNGGAIPENAAPLR